MKMTDDLAAKITDVIEGFEKETGVVVFGMEMERDININPSRSIKVISKPRINIKIVKV